SRTIPPIAKESFARWLRRRRVPESAGKHGVVSLFVDEFTMYSEPALAIRAIELLERLGYRVETPPLQESGRTWISKGFLREAKRRIETNLEVLQGSVTAERPLIGLEPSALLTFRDEAMVLASGNLQNVARDLAPHCLMLEEFLQREASAGRVDSSCFTDEPRTLHLHGHCFQKAFNIVGATVSALSLPANYQVQVIPSGCCGMAGSFGYEQEHYEISMRIGELVLLPAVRDAADTDLIVAPGTSCRHQIHDGAGKRALHPVDVLHEALRQPN
ncbi:MAG: hypothetical protein KDB14_14655, partial [Planctomycetales bacterium]|nr:hypothetical protein [Planctomycetales bacterium]